MGQLLRRSGMNKTSLLPACSPSTYPQDLFCTEGDEENASCQEDGQQMDGDI